MNLIKGFLCVMNEDDLVKALVPVPTGQGEDTRRSPAFDRVAIRIKGLKVAPNYEGCPFKLKAFSILRLLNATPGQYKVPIKDNATGAVDMMSVQDYFRKTYNVELKYPQLPLVQMERKACVYPMELLFIKGLQRWPSKLTDTQSRIMIRYTAAKPAARLNAINLGKNIIGHENDPILKTYGLEVGKNMIRTKARLLPNPEIQFGNARHNPGTKGRWDLRNKKFLKPNAQALAYWGVGWFTNQRDKFSQRQYENWIDGFTKMYKQHGGIIKNRPVKMELKEDIALAVQQLYEFTGRSFNAEPQLLIFIVGTKDAFTYLRIKKSCDCRWGVPSQVLQAIPCDNNKPQYHTNVLMKVNAKLGGVTNRVVPTSLASALRSNSAIIGADVTHAIPGVYTPSLAAMSLSNDAQGVSYMGNCQVNHSLQKRPRLTKDSSLAVEIIEDQIIQEMLEPLMKEWVATIGQGKRCPETLYYLRDGVSESEFKAVLHQEVPAIRKVVGKCMGSKVPWRGRITVIVASKRHHLRAWPDRNGKFCDDNGNPLPGTLVDRDVTSPHTWDFLLYAHNALQGTARPVHYKVILDEMCHKPEELENMIYEQSYQYIRSNTSVSIHPAIYYAHLITARARHHESIPADLGPQSGRAIVATYKPQPTNPCLAKDPQVLAAERRAELAKHPNRLLKFMETANRLQYKMWWV